MAKYEDKREVKHEVKHDAKHEVKHELKHVHKEEVVHKPLKKTPEQLRIELREKKNALRDQIAILQAKIDNGTIKPSTRLETLKKEVIKLQDELYGLDEQTDKDAEKIKAEQEDKLEQEQKLAAKTAKVDTREYNDTKLAAEQKKQLANAKVEHKTHK